MTQFSILYFKHSELVETERMSGGDILDAIDRAEDGRRGRRAEIWSGARCVGEIGGHETVPFRLPA